LRYEELESVNSVNTLEKSARVKSDCWSIFVAFSGFWMN